MCRWKLKQCNAKKFDMNVKFMTCWRLCKPLSWKHVQLIILKPESGNFQKSKSVSQVSQMRNDWPANRSLPPFLDCNFGTKSMTCKQVNLVYSYTPNRLKTRYLVQICNWNKPSGLILEVAVMMMMIMLKDMETCFEFFVWSHQSAGSSISKGPWCQNTVSHFYWD